MRAEQRQGAFLLYQAEDEQVRFQGRVAGNGLCLAQQQQVKLFLRTSQNIDLHTWAIYTGGGLLETATCKPYFQILSVGVRQISSSLRRCRLEVTAMAHSVGQIEKSRKPARLRTQKKGSYA